MFLQDENASECYREYDFRVIKLLFCFVLISFSAFGGPLNVYLEWVFTHSYIFLDRSDENLLSVDSYKHNQTA